MVSIRTKQPDKEMQRRGHLGAEAKKMRAGTKGDSDLIMSDNGNPDEFVKKVRLLDDDSQFGDESHPHDETDSSDNDNSDDESHLMDGRERLPLLLFGKTRKTKKATGTVKTPKPVPAAVKAVKPTVTPQPKPTQTVMEAIDPTTTAQDTVAKASTSRKSVAGESTPQKTTPSHPLDPGSDSQAKKKSKPNPPEAITVNYPAAPNPTKAPTNLNVQDCVYKSEKNSFLVKFHQTSDTYVHGYWTTFQRHVSQVRKSIKGEVFDSPLTQEDLNLLDLKAASTLFPTLVNSAGELRTRAEKEQRSKESLIEVLKEKQKTFQEISAAASKQAGKIQDRIRDLEASEHTKKSTRTQKALEEEFKSENSEKATLAAVIGAMPAPLSVLEAQRFSNTLADHITALAERYRQELSPLVMYIRRMATVLAGHEHRIMQLREYLAAMVYKQDETAKDYFFPKFMEVLAPDAHVCQCSKCVANQKSTKANETATEAGDTSNEIATKANLDALDIPAGSDYRDPSVVFKQPDLQLPDLSHHDLTPAMLEDLKYRYKGSKYTFEQYNALLDSAHQQYQREIKALEDYSDFLRQQDQAQAKAQAAQAARAPTEDDDEELRAKMEQHRNDSLSKANAADALNRFRIEEEEAYQSLSGLNPRDRNMLSLEERRLKIDKDYQKYKADLNWETQLRYAEDIRGAFFDRIITDVQELEDIIKAHKASGNPEPTPLKRPGE